MGCEFAVRSKGNQLSELKWSRTKKALVEERETMGKVSDDSELRSQTERSQRARVYGTAYKESSF